MLAKAAARDVKFCLAVATTLPGYRSMRELVGERDNVVFSCGVHPLNQDETYDVEDLRRFAAEEGVVAMGETGLDYFTPRKLKFANRNHSSTTSRLAVSYTSRLLFIPAMRVLIRCLFCTKKK